MKHAVLSASASKQWINCPPSIRLSEGYPNKSSTYAAEGTAAHELCEHKLKALLGLPTKDPTQNLNYYNEEMEDCANSYASYLAELLEAAKENCADPLVLIEQRLDFSHWVPDGFGTGDCVIVADGTLYVVDYKHGLGVEVSAERNTQMMCYGLGALTMFDNIYNIEQVSMTVYQPRKSNISTFVMPKTELYQWADEVLSPASELAFAGGGEFSCGDWCRFCRAKMDCKARAVHNLQLAKYEFRPANLLTDRDIVSILADLDRLVSWAKDIKDYAFAEALAGKKWDGYKLVAGRSTRCYTDQNAVINVVAKAGYQPLEQTVLGVTAMEKMLGKKTFKELLGELVHKPEGKPTLVPVSDKRQEVNSTADAVEDFRGE